MAKLSKSPQTSPSNVTEPSVLVVRYRSISSSDVMNLPVCTEIYLFLDINFQFFVQIRLMADLLELFDLSPMENIEVGSVSDSHGDLTSR